MPYTPPPTGPSPGGPLPGGPLPGGPLPGGPLPGGPLPGAKKKKKKKKKRPTGSPAPVLPMHGEVHLAVCLLFFTNATVKGGDGTATADPESDLNPGRSVNNLAARFQVTEKQVRAAVTGVWTQHHRGNKKKELVRCKSVVLRMVMKTLRSKLHPRKYVDFLSQVDLRHSNRPPAPPAVRPSGGPSDWGLVVLGVCIVLAAIITAFTVVYVTK